MQAFVQSGDVGVGMAFGPPALAAMRRQGLIDYIEVPFEQLRHDSSAISFQQHVPAILHCASMSVAGFVDAAQEAVDALVKQVHLTQSPWVGEHLAFVSANAVEPGGPPVALHYTVCPQLSGATLDRVVQNVEKLQSALPVPLILENPPQYFDVPGSTMCLVQFIRELCERTDVGLLLDVSHLLIAATNMGFDAGRAVGDFPLDRVVEVHLSGTAHSGGAAWDDHARTASPQTFELLEQVLERARPRAVTLEYNWGTDFDMVLLEEHLGRIRSAVGVRASS